MKIKLPFFLLLSFLLLPSLAAASDSRLLWNANVPKNSSDWPYLPAVDKDGNLYIPQDQGIYSFDSSGNKRWAYTWESFANLVQVSPALSSGGILYFATNKYGGKLFALDAEKGEVLWETPFFDSEVKITWQTSPKLSLDESKVYIGVEDYLFSFDAETGEKLGQSPPFSWSWGRVVRGTPLVSPSGDIFLGTSYGKIARFDPLTLEGTSFASWRASSAFLAADWDLGRIFAAVRGVSIEGKEEPVLYAFNIEPKEKIWHYILPSPITSPPVLGKDAVYIYTGYNSQEGSLLAVDKNTGGLRWEKTFLFGTLAHPTVSSEGIIYLPVDSLYALDSLNGETLWSYPLENTSALGAGSSPCLFGNIIFTVNREGEVFALKAGALEPPKFHPVIFIHGLGGRPEDWTEGNKKVYFARLKDIGYPEEFLAAYSYANADGNLETYDYQGDVKKIALDLPNLVDGLSELHKAQGGDGLVDIVGFSLGGVVAREYLNTNMDTHKVRKLITIGGPHRGVYLLEPESWLDSIPIFGPFLRRAVNNFLDTIFNIIRGSLDHPLDLNSAAVQQLIPSSYFLQELNEPTAVPNDLGHNTLYGNINAELKQKIFFYEFKKSFSIGDGLILKESATGIPVENVEMYEFSDEPVFELKVRMIKDPSGYYEYLIDTPSFDELRFRHTVLIIQPEVLEKVVEILISE